MVAFALDRASVLNQQFIQRVKTQDFPELKNSLDLKSVGLTESDLISLFQSQLLSRQFDLKARDLKSKNLGFYTIGSFGHEGNAAVALAARHTDPAFLHYRGGAFMIERARAVPDFDSVKAIALSLVSAKTDPISGGRHKVFGSVELNIPPQTSTIASHLPKAVGAALGIFKGRQLNLKTWTPKDSVVLCSFGDGSVNHATALSAFNLARWLTYCHVPLPMVFICEDNGIGISVKTPPNWISDFFQNSPGLKYFRANGLDVLETYQQSKKAIEFARAEQKPVFLHLDMVRLCGHAGSDIESVYLSEEEIVEQERHDPILYTAGFLEHKKILTSTEILNYYEKTKKQVQTACEFAIKQAKLDSAKAIMDPIIPPKLNREIPKIADQKIEFPKTPRTFAQLLNQALFDLLAQYPTSLVFGEDIAQKGGVYHVTAGLHKHYGPSRVFNTILDETSILGSAIGLAQQGFLPVPEIQFLAYYHNAQDQIRGEAATLSFFSNGQFTNPMIVRIPGLAYQKGFGGHFHNDNSLAALLDLPGVIVACPSNGIDAVKMLRYCFELAYCEQRVILFIEPIALYPVKTERPYPEQTEIIKLGEIGIEHHEEAHDIAIISFANGYVLSKQAAQILEQEHNLKVKLIDLRWLAPLPKDNLIKALKNIKNILIVDETRSSNSVSESILTLLYENLHPVPRLSRLTALDSFIPLGPASASVLLDKDDIVREVLIL